MRREAAAALALLAAHAGMAAADNPAEVVELGRVDVVGTSPLPGLGVPLANVPGNVQVFRAPTDRERFTPLPAMLERLAAGTSLASGQGNAFQPDFTYRGFVASALLGQPQGLSVFQDGVRLNEPFGDVVNWDLLPAAAIGSAHLIPASTPLFGPNALGGAVALYTRSGDEWRGGAVEAQAGSFGRRAVVIEQGGGRGAWDYYGTADALDEDGWAAHNTSRLRRAFAKIGHQTEVSDLDVSLTLADNRLEGSQALPVSFLGDIRQPYTYPDHNRNRVAMLGAKGSRFLSEGILLGATAYARRFENENFSSNVDANADPEDPAQGTNDRATLDERSHGGGLQLTVARPVGGRENVFLVGLSADRGSARYGRDEQPSRFDLTRASVAIGPFVPQVDAATEVDRDAIFFSDTFSASERWTITASGRQDVTRVRIADRSGTAPGLEGAHRFSRFNPGLGVNHRITDATLVYGAYAEGMRPPTAMELTCADPGAPCKLPNAFLSDPALRAVLARTFEVGGRGAFGERFAWTAALFRTELDDDIQFVGSGTGATNAGYFRNVAKTRREGLEMGLTTHTGAITLAARYAHLRATFRSAFVESSPNNASAGADGTILVQPGSRIPGIPADTLRLSMLLAPSEGWSAELVLSCSGGQRARGDENNADPAGHVPGFAVVGANARWRFAKDLELVALVDNLFDARYARSGLLGRNAFANAGHVFDAAGARPEAFRGPGAPFGAWLSLRWRWD